MIQEQKLLAGVCKTERTKIYALEELLTQVRQTIEDVAKETELVRELASVEDTCGNIRKKASASLHMGPNYMARGSSGLAAHLRRDSPTSAPGLAVICAGTGYLPEHSRLLRDLTAAATLAHICAGTRGGRSSRGRRTSACRHELLRREAEYFREVAANEAVSAAEVIRCSCRSSRGRACITAPVGEHRRRLARACVCVRAYV